jgi:hypothetical protein
MIKMTQKERAVIVAEMGEEVLSLDVDAFLLKLDAFITKNGFDENWDMTDYGFKMQCLYDSIFLQNEEDY